jgi:type I restriction enzyme, S subunit
MAWKDASLSDLGTVRRGKSRHRPRNDRVLFGGSYPFFQTGDVKAAELWLRDHQTTYNEFGLNQSKLWDAGTLCITIAANIAESAILAVPGCFPDSVVGFEAFEGVSDTRFIKYLLDHFKVGMQSVSHGTTQDNLSLDKLLRIRLRCPDYPTQKNIAAVLSSYDDLIENNTRRIQILEEMAQVIFREWFIEFRYPGHEDVPLAESELGLIPGGWDVGTLGDMLVLQRGFDLPKKSREPGAVPVVAATGTHGTHSNRAVCGPGVVTGRSGSLGTVMYVHDDFWPLNTTLWVKEFRRATPELAYFVLDSLDLASYNSGAAVPTLNRNDISGVAMPVPPESLVTRFSTMVTDSFDLVRTLRSLNGTLRATRDFLLPRLISGEVDISDLDVDTTDLVA